MDPDPNRDFVDGHSVVFGYFDCRVETLFFFLGGGGHIRIFF